MKPVTTSPSESAKSEKSARVVEATLRTLAAKGVPGVTYSAVARAAGVSRAWLYKYIGSSDEALLRFTVDTFGERYARLGDREEGHDGLSWVEAVVARFSRLLDSTVRYPWVLAIYFRYRGTGNLLDERIQVIEQKNIRKEAEELRRSFNIPPERAQLLAQVLLGIRLGLAHRWLVLQKKGELEKDQFLKVLRTSLQAFVRQARKH